MRRQNLSVLVSVVLALLAVVVFGTGCNNQFIEKPSFGTSDNVGGGHNSNQTTGSAVKFGAPSGLKSTQGGYREITLSWNPVKDAARYNVYRASTQFETFVQVGETAGDETSYTMKVASGADFYYRVAAVSHSGEQSPFSTIVRGTSLATPLISAIEGVEGKEDSDVTVYWYMGNVDAYQEQVRYNVICFDTKGTELARVVVDGSKSSSTEAVIPNLTPNTDYQYKVEAYLVAAQDKVEAGDPIDAATARRLRPNAPEELKVEQGQSTTGITLSFKLPALVDVALPGGLYEQKPLYFKIYRREYEEGSTDTEKGWTLLKADFGKTDTKPGEGETQKVKFGSDDEDYTPGKIVSWTDNTKLNRGVRYEYKVQSYAYYERDITSKYSASIATGWLVATATFSTGVYTPVLNGEQTANVSATLGFHLAWDTLGLDEEYHFILTETRYSLEKDEDDNVSKEKGSTFEKLSSVAAVNQYMRTFNGLDNKDVRGYYKYRLAIMSHDNDEILVLESLGRAIVTDDVDLPVIKLFSATSGYNDKVELQWQHNPKYSYTVSYSSGGAEAQTIDDTTLYANQQRDTLQEDATVTYIHNVSPGTKYEYKLTVTEKISVDSLPIVGRTSVAPSLTKKDFSYDALTVEWQDVPAESFTLAAKYKDGTTANRYPIDPQQLDGNDADTLEQEPRVRTASFDKPNGYTHATVSGKPVEISITATVPVTRTVHTLQGETGSSYDITTENVDTLELKNTIEHYTMGPAMVAAKADLGVYSDKIQLTWKKVEGAKAYVVIRNGFHISSNAGSVASDSAAHLDFKSTDMYLVKTTGSDTWTVEHKPSNQTIEKYFSVAFAGDTFTLTDNLYTDADSTLNEDQKQTMGQWIARQKEISWGAPYKYTVLPVLTDADVPEYDYEISPGLATLESAALSLTDLPLVNGTTKGYAWNVKATKGTYSENGENTGVKLTWTRPFTEAQTGYSVYRAEVKTEGEPEWEIVKGLTVAAGAKDAVDTSVTPGKMYWYMIAPSVGTASLYPYENSAYVSFSSDILDPDDSFAGERLANGFMLPQVQFNVSRQKVQYDDELGGKERLDWLAPVISGKADYLFEGYVVEVLNKDIDDSWHEIASYSVEKAPSYSKTVDNKDGLLKVEYNYRHYFRIRTYTSDEKGDRVLSKAPVYTWADGFETDLVKWGARALTHEEFLWCASEVMRQGIAGATNWQSQSWDWEETNNKKVYSTSSSGVGMWAFVFNNLKYNFMSVAGRLCAETSGAGGTPRYLFTNLYEGTNGAFGGDVYSGLNKSGYGWLNGRPYYKGLSTTYFLSQDELNALVAGKNGAGKPGEDITITGPSDVNGMYNGNIQFLDVKYEGNNPSGQGYIIVEVNGTEKHLHGGFKKYTTLPGA